MNRVQSALLLSFIFTGFISCSILRTDDPEKKAREYLATFNKSLSTSDAEILNQFRVNQSRDAVLIVIGILQNKDPFIVCDASMVKARLNRINNQIQVEIPVVFRVKELQSKDTLATNLSFTITPDGETFIISELSGEKFYQEFLQIKNQNVWEAEEKLAIQDRAWIYENAKKLENKFDSVIWFSTYENQNYFYVVEGKWINLFLDYNTKDEKNIYTKMGLADSDGNLIIPFQYDQIGTIGFTDRYMVEVVRENKVGYFNVKTGKEVIEPIYDLIVYYGWENAWAAVKKDSVYGWIDTDFNFHEGFVSDKMKKWVTDFEYLKQKIHLKAGYYSYCEIPNAEYAGSGIIIPPSYLSEVGIFDPIESGFNSASVRFGAYSWTDYKETTSSFLETITSNLRAVITTIRERYLEGREEFYTHSSVTFVDAQNNKLGTSSIPGEATSIRSIDSTLLEVRTPHDYWFMEESASDETNLYDHDYYTISDGKIEPLNSKRLYPQTEYVKLDSSYLIGDFIVDNDGQEQNTNFLSLYTIKYMRDEILAAYGYNFPDSKEERHFNYVRDKELPQYGKIEEIELLLSDVDRHNLLFLNKVLDLMATPAL
jgi:hypothetical protein